MQNTDVRTLSERKRIHSRPGDRPRRWLAIGLALIALAAAWAVLGRDVGWERRSRASRERGDTAGRNGNYEAARTLYETALANDRYDWETHLALADLLAHKLDDPGDALRHYTYALAYSGNPSIVEATRQEMTILRLMRSGELENPRDAVEDMFLSVEGGARDLFAQRLSGGLRPDEDAFWQAWTQRGRGSIEGMRIANGHDGLYDAALEVAFADGTTMLMHFRCPLRDIWRLDVSFP